MLKNFRIIKESWLYFILLLIIALPFSINVSNYLIGIVVFISLLNKKKILLSDLNSKEQIALFFFTALYFINIFSLLYTTDFSNAADLLVLQLPILIFPLIFYFKIKPTKKQINLIFGTYIFAILLATLVCLIFAFAKLYRFEHSIAKLFEYDYAYHNFSQLLAIHPTYFSLYILFAIILSFYFLRNEALNWRKLSLFILIIVLSFGLFLSMSRIIIITYLLLVIFVVPHHVFKGRMVRYSQMALISFIFLFMAILYIKIPYFKERVKNDFLLDLGLDDQRRLDKGGSLGSSRILRWKCALKEIIEEPILGHGVGDGQPALRDCYEQDGLTIAYDLDYNSHNQYLDILLNNGLIGIIVFIGSLTYAFRSKDFIYVSFGIIILMSCMTENILDRQKGVVFYAFFNALLASQLRLNGNS